MLFIEDLGVLVLWLIFMVMSVNLVFMFFVFYRRLSRQRYFSEKDAARIRYAQPLGEFVSGRMTSDAAIGMLASATTRAERDIIEELLLANVVAENTESVSELFFALGFVEEWSHITFGRRRTKDLVRRSMATERAIIAEAPPQHWWRLISRLRIFAVPRALALNSLGQLAPRYAGVFLAEGLKDPSAHVRRVSIQNMGRNRFPEAIPLLLGELKKAVEEGNDVSLRTMKSALICYNLADLDLFLPFLNHPNQRMRFFVTDTFREICNKTAGTGLLSKNEFSPELCRMVLDHGVNDEFADVRARSAWVIRHFRDHQATEALRKLMRDDNEFVRLHAVRSVDHIAYMELIPDLVARLTDVRWRVREAAVGSLAKFGAEGLNEMYRFFVSCSDAFACEQITEEIQRKGLIPDLVATLMAGGVESDLGRQVCMKMAMMHKTSLLIHSLASVTVPEVRVALMESLATAPTEEFIAVLQMITGSSSGTVAVRASQILHKSGSKIVIDPAGKS